MDSVLVASPHYDDAVLSCGQFLAGRPDAVIVTVFGGAPPAPASTDFDRRSGFSNAAQAIAGRAREDREAVAILGGWQMPLPFLDQQYRPDEDAPVAAIIDALAHAHGAADAVAILAPLGIAHPDHRAVTDAALALARCDYEVWLYEELPGRVLWPEQVCERIAALAEDGFYLDLGFIGDGPLSRKRTAVAAYGSQMWALDRRCCFVPERFHHVSTAG